MRTETGEVVGCGRFLVGGWTRRTIPRAANRSSHPRSRATRSRRLLHLSCGAPHENRSPRWFVRRNRKPYRQIDGDRFKREACGKIGGGSNFVGSGIIRNIDSRVNVIDDAVAIAVLRSKLFQVRKHPRIIAFALSCKMNWPWRMFVRFAVWVQPRESLH